jgi:hypothetical protein
MRKELFFNKGQCNKTNWGTILFQKYCPTISFLEGFLFHLRGVDIDVKRKKFIRTKGLYD